MKEFDQFHFELLLPKNKFKIDELCIDTVVAKSLAPQAKTI